jgi:tetratricopeptide (TPR) repeat protein
MLLLINGAIVRSHKSPQVLVVCRLLLYVAALYTFGVSPLLGQGGFVAVEGKVRTDSGVVPSGVTIQIDNEDGGIEAQKMASASGGFIFETIHKKICTLTATAEGYETSQQSLDLTRTANTVFVTVILIPTHNSKRTTDLPALTDSKASKNAQKEFEKGDNALNARKLKEAEEHLEKAVADSPCYARAQTELATVRAEQQKMVEAEVAAKKARDCDPDFIEAYLQLGMIFNNEKKFTESEAALQEGIRRAPSHWLFYYQIAVAHYGQGKFAQAQQDYQRVLSLNSTPPAELHVKLADVYLKENNYDKAYDEMGGYLKEEPNGRFASKVKGIMHQMQAAGVVQKDKLESVATKPHP